MSGAIYDLNTAHLYSLSTILAFPLLSPILRSLEYPRLLKTCKDVAKPNGCALANGILLLPSILLTSVLGRLCITKLSTFSMGETPF